jgi:hypothetical protein
MANTVSTDLGAQVHFYVPKLCTWRKVTVLAAVGFVSVLTVVASTLSLLHVHRFISSSYSNGALGVGGGLLIADVLAYIYLKRKESAPFEKMTAFIESQLKSEDSSTWLKAQFNDLEKLSEQSFYFYKEKGVFVFLINNTFGRSIHLFTNEELAENYKIYKDIKKYKNIDE